MPFSVVSVKLLTYGQNASINPMKMVTSRATFVGRTDSTSRAMFRYSATLSWIEKCLDPQLIADVLKPPSCFFTQFLGKVSELSDLFCST